MANYGVKGSVLQVMIGSTYTNVGQIQSLSAPGTKMGTRDVTHLTSATKEYESTIGDPQEMAFVVIYDPADVGARLLETRVTTPSTVLGGDSFKVITASTAKNWGFQGIVTDFTPNGGDVEGTWLANCAIRASRAITPPTT
jgi:hypothetical protein